MNNSITIQSTTNEKIISVDEVLEPVLNPPPSIEISNVTVSFKTSRWKLYCCEGDFTDCKERRDRIPDRSFRLR